VRRLLVVVLLLAGCAAVQGTGDPTTRERTIADQVLAFDASKAAGGDPACRSRKVIDTKVSRAFQAGSQPPAGQWSERWTVNRCGERVPYEVHYLRATDGHLGVTIVREEGLDHGVIDGSTIADRLLQRDTLVLLTQKDLSETEGQPCRIRRVLNTELLNPVAGGQVENGKPVAGQWVERWTLDRCGAPVRYIVHFTTTRAGTTFTAEREQ
jgi:hypothetical protein